MKYAFKENINFISICTIFLIILRHTNSLKRNYTFDVVVTTAFLLAIKEWGTAFTFNNTLNKINIEEFIVSDNYVNIYGFSDTEIKVPSYQFIVEMNDAFTILDEKLNSSLLDEPVKAYFH